MPDHEKPIPYSMKSKKESSTLSEVQHQHPFFRDLVYLISDANSQTELDHEKPIFENKMHADFAFIKKGKPHVTNFIVNVVETQLGDSIDTEHLGKTLVYNDLILARNPKRSFIVSIVTNFDHLILFSTRRDPKNNTTVRKHSIRMDFWTDGLRYAYLS